MSKPKSPRRSSAAAARASAPPPSPAGDDVVAIALVGLGAEGLAAARAVLTHEELSLVAVCEPSLVGRKLQELVPGAPRLVIGDKPEAAFRAAAGGVAIVTGDLPLDELVPLAEKAFAAGLSVVADSEELCAPEVVDATLATRLDRAASKAGRSVIGAGPLPGAVLLRLAATLASAAGEVRHAELGRVMQARFAPAELRGRLGLGLTAAAFDTASEEGELGLPGLSGSVALLADGTGLELDEVEEELTPVIASQAIDAPDGAIASGRVAGIVQIARGFAGDREVVRISIELSIDPAKVHDSIRLDAAPPLALELPGGLQEPASGAAALANTAVRIAAAEPGLLTVLDLPAGR